ncbi:MAG TPA: hypothetical protein VH234_01245 [Candidatus Saccharimonadales bacterium]|jgi:hypothetical protein|nr:hypothetical protein [Candidatus Saccharimonadales bacterium]
MSLTESDRQYIRTISREANLALENDIKEIYHILTKMSRGMTTDANFKKLSFNNKLLTLNAELLGVASHVGITLPRA